MLVGDVRGEVPLISLAALDSFNDFACIKWP